MCGLTPGRTTHHSNVKVCSMPLKPEHVRMGARGSQGDTHYSLGLYKTCTFCFSHPRPHLPPSFDNHLLLNLFLSGLRISHHYPSQCHKATLSRVLFFRWKGLAMTACFLNFQSLSNIHFCSESSSCSSKFNSHSYSLSLPSSSEKVSLSSTTSATLQDRFLEVTTRRVRYYLKMLSID